MKLRDVRPRYRQAWASANLEGSVLMQARIGVDGKVRAVEVVSPGNVDLEDEAIAAVSQWEFSPTYLNCEPIEVRMYVTVSFKIER
jgi:TonB family protein